MVPSEEYLTHWSNMGVEASAIGHMKRALRLTEEEEDDGGLIADGLWQADVEKDSLFVVGRLLSQRPFNFEGMCASIWSMFMPVRGMEFKQLPEGRILMRFSHVIDRNRGTEGCPWSFEKNILILSEVGSTDNLMNVDLNWCEFYVYIHNLPLSKMNLGIATHISNRIGRFRDMEPDESDRAWGVSLRILVAINVNDPLKRALKIDTTGEDEHTVYFTYERLPNFCYLCGRTGHIAKYCKSRFDEGFIDPGEDMPYSPWLRAPMPPRSRSQTKSSSASVGTDTSRL
ncbi:UNVERIFIED_CONTAM: hypothetical protein Slati_3440500 [Sesamum latifolium]|uniref:CCHC-type domain-containing protein n=1 Tax=Sesamum latifolium TaxID=2727402 RepID=A0AAW2UJF9_9LAMI